MLGAYRLEITHYTLHITQQTHPISTQHLLGMVRGYGCGYGYVDVHVFICLSSDDRIMNTPLLYAN